MSYDSQMQLANQHQPYLHTLVPVWTDYIHDFILADLEGVSEVCPLWSKFLFEFMKVLGNFTKI